MYPSGIYIIYTIFIDNMSCTWLFVLIIHDIWIVLLFYSGLKDIYLTTRIRDYQITCLYTQLCRVRNGIGEPTSWFVKQTFCTNHELSVSRLVKFKANAIYHNEYFERHCSISSISRGTCKNTKLVWLPLEIIYILQAFN